MLKTSLRVLKPTSVLRSVQKSISNESLDPNKAVPYGHLSPGLGKAFKQASRSPQECGLYLDRST
jgi:hypothetical protein